MEKQTTAMDLLELMLRPGFCVKNGTITQVNQAAARLFIEAGTQVLPLLLTGRQEYAAFSGGCLYLTLKINQSAFSASVTRVEDCDIFLLEEPEEDEAELQAYALAAQALREPLSALMTLPDMGLADSDDPRQRRQAAQINRSLFRILRLVSNMSDARRYRTQDAPRLEMRDITAVLDDLFGKLTTLCRQAGAAVTFSNLPTALYCLVDTEKLERGIYNIFSNALKFSSGENRIDAALTRKGNWLYLTIRDHGSGIPQDQRGTVYRRFLRQPGIEDGRQGIGLGMLLICAAATAHGGTVLMESPAEGGTRITITLEIRQKSSDTVRSPLLQVDYAGEWDHSLTELSEALPDSLYLEDSGFF